MVNANDLEGMQALQELNQDQLQKLAAIGHKSRYVADTVLFRHREKLDYYNLLLEGEVGLTLDVDSRESLPLEVIKPGRSFGISALIPGKRGSARAVCRRDSTVIHLPGDKMLDLFERDSDMGYRFMCREVRSFKSRMHQRTRQFVLVIEYYPEFEQALEKMGHVFYG